MKKTLAILLVLMLLVSALTGCGNNKKPAANSTNNSATNPTENTAPSREIAKTEKIAAAEKFAGGSGTEADPFQISEAGHLVLLHEMLKKEEAETKFDDTYVKGHYILTADISLNDTSNFANWSTTAPKYGWEPIGTGVISNTFAGVLDGNGHKISGMFIDADSGNKQAYYGLFTEMGGTVKNLDVEKSYICVSGGVVAVGTIAGSTNYSNKSVIENCQVSSEIKLYNDCQAGGIVGTASSSKVSNCSYAGAITQLDSAFSHIGGVSGYGGAIADCTVAATVTGNGHTGGIVGFGNNVVNCVNKGAVSGDTAGGISGRVYAAGTNLEIKNTQETIENCTNEGRVTGVSLAGGIVGWMGNDESDISMSVIACENKGEILCDKGVAGIIGKLSVERTGVMTVKNCINHKAVSGKGFVGGIIGQLLGGILHQEGIVNISGCKNLGRISSEDQYSAGIVAYLLIMSDEVDMQLTLENCLNEGAIQSTSFAGGIIGFSNVGFNAEVSAKNMKISDATKVTLKNCSNSGGITAITSNSMAGGIVGILGLGYIPTEIDNCENSGDVAIDFTLTDQQIAELQDLDWPEFYQIGGGIVGRIGDGLKLTTGEGIETSAANVNTADGKIVISGCKSTGEISAPDYSTILNKWEKPLYVNYLGGVVGQCSATDGYAFSVENCTYSGAERGLGDAKYPDFGTKN
ncbi:MAG: hypothetical protein IJX01_03295 [Oscillospiraceae bacterium]|nr:hypothetical protein [Oscillospiraceae bacterium]